MATEVLSKQSQTTEPELQLVTFNVGDICLGIDIGHVQEINRQLDVTPVPEASPMIHGVVNLRGDVVTVLDPHRIFGIQSTGNSASKRNLILNIDGERIGILVDRVSDILSLSPSELSRRPSNVRDMDRRFIDAVYVRSEEIVVVINAVKLLATIELAGDATK